MHPLLDSLQLFLDNFTYLGLLMTFGAVFPPLAFSFFVTIYLMNHNVMFKLDRFLIYAKEKNRIDYIKVIEEECRECFDSDVVMWSVWVILGISSCFYTIFLFDTLGTTKGVSGAYWVLIVTPLVPLFDFIMYRLFDRGIWVGRGEDEREGGVTTDGNTEVELATIGNPIISI